MWPTQREPSSHDSAPPIAPGERVSLAGALRERIALVTLWLWHRHRRRRRRRLLPREVWNLNFRRILSAGFTPRRAFPTRNPGYLLPRRHEDNRPESIFVE